MTLLIRLIVGFLIGWYGMQYLQSKGYNIFVSLAIIFAASCLAGFILTLLFNMFWL